MNALEKLQNKPREKRNPLEQCVVDAAVFEEAEHDGEIELMEQAAEMLEVFAGAKDVIDKLQSKNEALKSQVNNLNLLLAQLEEKNGDMENAIRNHFETVQIPTASLLPTEKALLAMLSGE